MCFGLKKRIIVVQCKLWLSAASTECVTFSGTVYYALQSGSNFDVSG